MDKRPWRQPRHAAPAVQPVIIRPAKSPGLAAVLSFFLCGLGQVYNGQFLKALVFLLAFVLSALSTVIVVGFVLVPIMWLVGIIDAYKSAEALNRR